MEVYVGTAQITYSDLTADTEHSYVLSDQRTGQVEISGVATSSGTGDLDIPLPVDRFSKWFALTVFEGTTLVVEDSVDIVRPYAKPAEIVTYTANKADLTTAVEYEAIARYMIDAIVGFSFRYEAKRVTVNGHGSDFLTFDERLMKVNSIKQNNETIWENTDTAFEGVDGAFVPVNHWYALTFVPTTEDMNAMEHNQTWSTRYFSPLFPNGYDFEIDGEWGWPVVPEDIRKATLLLANDIACGTNRYSSKYIDSFRNGTVTIDHFKEVIKGTGNLIVDNILSKYVLESVRVKVL